MAKLIPINVLHEDPRSANRMAPERFEKLVENIKHTKLTQPLAVRPHPEQEGHFIIIDGHYRKKALERLGIETARCDIWKVNADEAAFLLSTLNRLRGEDHPKKRAELLQGLLKRYEKERLAQLIPESAQEIDNLIAILKQEDDVTSKLREQIEKERQSLQVILNFVVSKAEADKIEATLNQLDSDKNAALVKLCEAVNNA